LAPTVTARFGLMRQGGLSTSVYAHDPCHVAAAVVHYWFPARRGWRIRRKIPEMFRADIIVTDLFRFDCQLELMCLANGENAATACRRSNQRM
jgi:hypothetical protein